ncbi:hypothetical protein MLD38_037904 [Melastoma candidum]|uniref:Uncharacterized protein n=1 Tax=Melastoma candidum TaxID=119954 RepID=A0ACB9KXU6_9MYRT|nr:hypothetical protein MLD38_037904 [Melastoma candidum]
MAYKNSGYGLSSAPVSVLAHLLALAITSLLLAWLLHFRGGLSFDSINKQKIFNLHPLFMVIGFILMGGEAIMVYKTMAVKKEAQKATHWVLHLVALISGIIGIYAVFKFHNELHIPNVYTLHSWMGLVTISLFGLQWILGFFSFVFPGSNGSSRTGFLPWHALLGAIIFLMAVCTAEMGIAEKFIFTGLKRAQEALVLNFTGLLIFLFAVCVGLAVILPSSF